MLRKAGERTVNDGKKLALLGAAVLCLYLFCSGPDEASASLETLPAASTPVQSASPELMEAPKETVAATLLRSPASASEKWEESFFTPSRAEEAVRMTISSSVPVKNETDYLIDDAAAIKRGTSLRLAAEGPQILIIHTHSSEAYTPAGLDRYEPTDNTRTEDPEHNIIRVGDELTRLFEQAGLRVIHDRGVYDYPSYTGSYGRSGAAVEQYLCDYPSITVVLDVHRDALGAEDVIYKTVAEEDGTCASQAMLLVGTDESGLEHPNWRENLSFALYLQSALSAAHPTLMRPVAVVPQRYNQQLCPGMLILEVGSSGNTMQEALAAVRLFAEAAAPALLALVG